MKNKYERLNIKDFNSIEALAAEVVDRAITFAEMHIDMGVTICAKAEFIYELLKIIVFKCGVEISYIKFERGEFAEYDDVYFMRIDIPDGIFLEPSYGKDGVLYSDFNCIAYIYQEDCQQDIIDHMLDCDCVPILFGLIDDNDGDDFGCKHDKCECCTDTTVHRDIDECGNMHGFTVGKSRDDGYCSFSYYSTDRIDKKCIQDILRFL